MRNLLIRSFPIGGAIIVASSFAACSAPAPTDTSLSAQNEITSMEESSGLYHWSEGGEFTPYFVLRALRVQVDGQTVPFLSPQSLSRFGWIPDPVSATNPEGLPIGMTLARAPDTGLVSIGVNCAACHTSQIDYVNANGAPIHLRVEGGPSRFDFSGFFSGMTKAILAEMGPDASTWDKAEFAVRALEEAAKTPVPYQDFDGTPDSAWSRFKMLWTVVLHASDASDGDIEPIINAFDLPAERKALMIARYYGLRSVLAHSGDLAATKTGPGRVDPYGASSNYLFAGQYGFYSPPTSPARYQPLFGIGNASWFAYTSNTQSMLERNAAQAAGISGVTDLYGDNPTYATSVNFPNLVSLEKAVEQIQPPRWPTDLARDPDLAARGQAIYQNTCAGCHDTTTRDNGLYDINVTSQDVVGTDPNIINRYLMNIQFTPTASGNFSQLANPAIAIMTQNYCQSANLSATDCLALNDQFDANDNPSGRRGAPGFSSTAVGYQAKPLNGVWAMAPYLHNGSVPSLADLLQPAANRPVQFAVGQTVYDPARVGYVFYPDLSDDAQAAGATFVFDTTQPGNSNAGHEGDAFGTNLSDDDKTALLEYLKDFGN